MFGSNNPFGQSSSSPFASQSPFGQTSSSHNPFAPKAFGSTSSFGAQTGGSMFGGISTGVFGAPASSPFSTSAFGASTFGSSTPAFGGSSSPFGGSSVFGQKPAFGSGSTAQSPFGGSPQQSQPAFGGSVGSSTPFGASSQSAFGSSSPAFGVTSTPAFGTTSTLAFGASSTPAFGATSTPAFGSTGSPAFGSTGTAFGVSSFGTSNAFGASSTPSFGASNAPAFGTSSTLSLSFGSSPAFGQSTSAFTSNPFGAQSSPFGAQSSTPAFGNTSFGQAPLGGQHGGSRVSPYTPTNDAEGGSGAQSAGKLNSISAMPVFKDKSHEELRWEDYQLGDKGGPQPAQTTGGIGFNASTTQTNPFAPSTTHTNPFAPSTTQTNPFAPSTTQTNTAPSTTPTFGQTAANQFSSTTASNPFAAQTPSFSSTGFATSTTTVNPFGPTSTDVFGPSSSSSTSTSTSPFTSSTPFTTGPSLFGSSTTPSIGSSPSFFVSAPGQGTTSSFGTGLNISSQTSPLFNSTTPSIGQTSSNPAFGQNTTSCGPTSIFNTPSTAFSGNSFSNSTSLAPSNPDGFGQTAPTFTSSFQPAQPAQATSSFGLSNFGQAQPGGTSSIFGQNTVGKSSNTQNPAVMQPVAVTNPLGTLPAMPQVSIGQAGTAPSVQYGISSMPVVDKPAPARISPLLTSRHISQRRIRLPVRINRHNNGSSKVPFFSDDDEAPSTPKADAVFIPRENPRALVIRPTEQWPKRAFADKTSPRRDTPTPVQENDISVENGSHEEIVHPAKFIQKSNGVHETYKTLSGHRAGEAAVVYEHGADVEALMPKLRQGDYYTEPRIQELAAKERAEPGYCCRVKDFVVGRHGYGSIKFLGETDVRQLDLESLVQFNYREVIVYMDESKKPPVGQGLNKSAEVALFNIKCFEKKTGRQYTEGPKIEKYKEMLKRKAEDQGAEFVSYDPFKGEWKFRVNHFSAYKLEDEEDDDSNSET